jgi:flagellar hook-length control protein FliK
MQANLLIVDHQNTIPSRKPDHSKGLDGGLIEKGQEQGGEENNFSSTLAEVENEQQSHPGPVDESRVERTKSENGKVESEDLKKEASGGIESEDIKEDAEEGLAKAGKTSGPFLVLEGKAGAGSGNERAVKGEESPADVEGINRGAKGVNKADHNASMDLNKAKASKVDFPGFGLKGKKGESEDEKGMAKSRGPEKREGFLREVGSTPETKGKETSEGAANPRGVEKTEKTEGLLRAMSATPETKGKETSEGAANPRGVEKTEKTEGLLRAMSATPETKGKETSEGAANPRGVEKTEKTEGLLRAKSVTPETKGKETSEVAATPAKKGKGTSEASANLRGFEKAEGRLKDFREESSRTNRDVNDKEPAAQKLRTGLVKGSTEESVQKEPGIEASTQRLGIDPKDTGSETVKIKVSEGSLAHKKVEKTESGNGENSNLSSRNYSPPDKGTGAISQPKEPQTFTKSAQADTLRQIVNKAALNVKNGRSEFKIDLKPESLGHLKMQILTENNRVTVRILAENPLVKDMIESNLGQLKANFQNQGLEIEKFDVSVARDSDQNGTGDGRYGSRKMRAKSGDPKNGYDGKLEEPEEIDARARRGQGEGAVNFFA